MLAIALAFILWDLISVIVCPRGQREKIAKVNLTLPGHMHAIPRRISIAAECASLLARQPPAPCFLIMARRRRHFCADSPLRILHRVAYAPKKLFSLKIVNGGKRGSLAALAPDFDYDFHCSACANLPNCSLIAGSRIFLDPT